jgi:hypothetical protein
VNDDIAYAPRHVYDFVIEPPRDLSFSTTAEVLGTGSGNLSWNAANGSNIRGYVVEMSADNGVTYEELGRTSNNKFDVTGLQAGVYTFSVRSYTISTALSARAVLINNTIQLKTVGKVAVIYADTGDTATNNQSYNLNSNTFVGYYEYDGDRPTLPIRSNLTFSEFIGPPGADGDDGSDGARGAGWWRYETGTSTSVSCLTTSTLNTFFATATGLSPSAADRFIVVNTNDEAVAYLRSETNSAWIQQADFLDGDLLVNGTVTAEKLTVTNLEAISANIGTLRTATTGQRMELRDNKILVYDSSNVLRVKIGDLS